MGLCRIFQRGTQLFINWCNLVQYCHFKIQIIFITCKLVVQSLVTSRFDYSNGLIYRIPKSSVSILQSVQNSTARIVTKTAPREHITPVLKELHLLPWTGELSIRLHKRQPDDIKYNKMT